MSGGSENLSAEVAVIGGGPAGLLSAIALEAAGVDTLLIAPQPAERPPHHRPARGFGDRARHVGVLGGVPATRRAARHVPHCRRHRRLMRAPEVIFSAAEIGLDAFGYNIENRHLIAALDARARS